MRNLLVTSFAFDLILKILLPILMNSHRSGSGKSDSRNCNIISEINSVILNSGWGGGPKNWLCKHYGVPIFSPNTSLNAAINSKNKALILLIYF